MAMREPIEFDSFEQIEAVFKQLADLEKAYNEAHTETATSKGAEPQPICRCKGTHTMKMNEAFPSRYLKADDVEDEPVLTIEYLKLENVAPKGEKEEKKAVLYFEEIEKGMVVNKTNWETISEIFGSDDSDDWIGKRIQLYQGESQFRGEKVDAIRVKKRKKSPAPAPAMAGKAAHRAQDPGYDGSPSDDIPF